MLFLTRLLKSIVTIKFSLSSLIVFIILFIYVAPNPDTNPLKINTLADGYIEDKYINPDFNKILVINKKAFIVSSDIYNAYGINSKVQLTNRVEDFEGKKWLYYLCTLSILFSVFLFIFSFVSYVVDLAQEN